jgi:hypothetical protein
MAVSFIGGGNQCTRRKPPTCRKLAKCANDLNDDDAKKWIVLPICQNKKSKTVPW